MRIMQKDTITSLELLEQINMFRKLKSDRSENPDNRLLRDVRHDNLLLVIREELDEEIVRLEVKESKYINSQMAQSCMKTVIAKYKSVKSNGHSFNLINFKNPEYDLVWNRDYSLNLNKQIFSVNSIDGRLKIPFEIKSKEKYFDGTWSFGTAKLVYKFNKFFYIYLYQKNTLILIIQNTNSCGKLSDGTPLKWMYYDEYILIQNRSS